MHFSTTKIVSDKGEEIMFNDHFEMENLFEKLKLLNYYSELGNMLKLKPINNYYFVIPRNAGEQFFVFSSLSAWLIRKLGKHFDEPQEYDDPNNIIASILQVIREHGFVIEFPPNKLKQGVGGHVVFVLNKLCDEVLKKEETNWDKRPEFVEENEIEEQEAIENESEIILDQIEEEMLAAYSDDSDEDVLKIDDINVTPEIKSQIIKYNINFDSECWRMELEKVLPQLKLTIKSNSHDWRLRLEHMKNSHSQIKQLIPSARMQLTKIHRDIFLTLEKVQNREKYLNKELESVLKEYIVTLNQLSKIKELYNVINSNITEKTRQFARLNDTLEIYKHQMEARGNSMTDGTPLVNIKKNISKLKVEILEMDVRIGVLECFLLYSRLREKRMLEEDMNYAIKIY